jgi:hypothetical protein
MPVAALRATAWALVCGLLLSAPAAAQNADTAKTNGTAAASASSNASTSGGYYIEFRAAEIGTYGHSYVVYGRLDARGRPASASYADLHPMGNYAIMALGHLVPVPANTVWDPDVLKLPIASKYRRNLSSSQYHKLLAAVRETRKNANPVWNALFNNCNTYIAELAKAIGLRVPTQFQVSYAFVPALRELNESNASSKSAHPAARPARSAAKPPS